MTSKRTTSKRPAHIVNTNAGRTRDLTLTVTENGVWVHDNTTGHKQFITITVLETVANLTATAILSYECTDHYNGDESFSGELEIGYSQHRRDQMVAACTFMVTEGLVPPGHLR
jgi:hypothetical protein